MSENLLRNGSFEEGWSQAGGTGMIVYTVDSDGNPGAVEIIERDENRPPAGWTSWCLRGTPVQHDSGNTVGWSEPEVNQIHKSVDERRVADGEWALRMFTFHRIHECGVLQRVELPDGHVPNQLLQFSAFGHAWSSQDDDKMTSEGASEPFFDYHDPDAPHSSDLENFTLTAGIDPTGGADPYADTVIWGDGVHIYNAYYGPGLYVTAETTGAPFVTVFLRSSVKWPFKHCDVYFDSTGLYIYPPEEPTEPPEPTEIGVNLARIADTLEDIRDILRENAGIQISGNGSGVVLEDWMGVDWGRHNDYAVLRKSDSIHDGRLSGLRRKMAGLFCG